MLRALPHAERHVAFRSCDEKPGIQAIATTAPDLPPNRREASTVQRDHEYKRLGTVTRSGPSSGIETSHLRWDHRSRNLEQNSSSGFLLRGLQVRVLLGSPLTVGPFDFSKTYGYFWQTGFLVCQLL